MKENAGLLDQNMRYLSGMLVLKSEVVYESVRGHSGTVPLMSALIACCPPCALTGIKTNKSAD
ncbi:MAG: DUF2892 domain-containing protein [Gammaproteobacteria bacterium]|nr:DUF2892 domain-containing protein [Gammaproteobacteria bacterium]